MWPFQGRDPGSSPGIGIMTSLAQLVEHQAFSKRSDLVAAGSTPAGGVFFCVPCLIKIDIPKRE